MLLLANVSVKVLRVDQAVRLDSLRSATDVEMVIAIQSLVPLDGLFELKLNLRQIRRKLKGDFIDEL